MTTFYEFIKSIILENEEIAKEIVNHLGLLKAERKLQSSTPKSQNMSTGPRGDYSDSRDAISNNGLNLRDPAQIDRCRRNILPCCADLLLDPQGEIPYSPSPKERRLRLMVSQRIGPLLFIQGENRGRYPYCNSVYVEEAGILIDPASDRQALLEIKGTKPVRHIWLSHWHEDHFMHLDLFDEVPLRISERDLPPLTGVDTFLDWYGMENPEYRAFWATLLKDQFHYKPRTPASFFSDQEIIALGALTVEVVPTPGHTPGNLAFYFREPEILFLGDYDLTPFGPWYGDVYSDIDQTIESIRRLKAIPARVWLAGHETGLFTQTPEELWTRYEEIIYERESKLLDFLSEPRTLDDITAAWIVYGRPREPKAFFEFGERAIMKKHLERLRKNGQILQEGNFYACP